MSLFHLVRDLVTGRMWRPVSQWFTVEFDDEVVRLQAEPPGRKPWSQQFRWSDVERICFKAEDHAVSDGVYVFTRLRPEGFAVPTEASGGADFWAEVIRRGLFPARLAIEAASSPGDQYWWPEEPS